MWEQLRLFGESQSPLDVPEGPESYWPKPSWLEGCNQLKGHFLLVRTCSPSQSSSAHKVSVHVPFLLYLCLREEKPRQMHLSVLGHFQWAVVKKYLGLNAQRRGVKVWLQGAGITAFFLLQRFEGEKVKQMRFNGTQVTAVNGRLDKFKKPQTNVYLLCSLSSSWVALRCVWPAEF